MGVPAFFRWLSARCPKIVIDALERYFATAEPADVQRAREESIENGEPLFDNLYLDMNGIIHPCCHPEEGAPPQTEADMFNNIFSYIDKLMRIVRPRKLVYMAVDGVAPRAKMNQQRSRRFRSAIDAKIKLDKEDELKRIWEEKGEYLPETLKAQSHCIFRSHLKIDFDSNVITPGTPFMDRLAEALRFYIYDRLNNDPLWKGLVIIFSDAQVPGEGEHKILEYIRLQRAQEGYDPNLVHCLYGADADLIMLGLSTHEVNFYVLREVFVQPSDKVCSNCGQRGHLSDECEEFHQKSKEDVAKKVQFQYISIWRVREFLELEFRNVETPFEKDFERIIDDFVFLCFFVGNDFLPHLPSLYIRQGAIDSILMIYKKMLPALGGYLTNEGTVDYKKVDVLFEKIGVLEEALLREKLAMDERERQKNERKKGARDRAIENEKYLEERENELKGEIDQLKNVYTERIKKEDYFPSKEKLKAELNRKTDFLMLNLKEIQKQKDQQKKENESYARYAREMEERKEARHIRLEPLEPAEKNDKIAIRRFNNEVKDMLRQVGENEAKKYEDTIQFGKEGYKFRYYAEKFNIEPSDLAEFKQGIQRHYIEGLSWVLAYYYNGCASWGWYYPYHYAPLASDLLGSDQLPATKFDLGKPFLPFEQLMSVLPPNSSHALPKPLAELINDQESEIADFYPTYFKLDINGQRYAWMGVNLLPFIEEDRLLAVLNRLDTHYSTKEKKRNTVGTTRIYARSDSQLGRFVGNDYTEPEYSGVLPQRYEPRISGGVSHNAESVKLGAKIKRPDERLNLSAEIENEVICCEYIKPEYRKHVPKLLPYARIPPRSITYRDILQTDRRRPGECLAIKITERMMGIDQQAPELVTTYINLRNQPHQRSYVDDHNRGISAPPMIYKSWAPPRQRYGVPAPPPGPLAVQYGAPQRPYVPPPPPRPIMAEPTRPMKRALAEEPAAPTQQTTKRGKYEDDRLEQVKAALHTFFENQKTEPQRAEDPRMRARQMQQRKEEKK